MADFNLLHGAALDAALRHYAAVFRWFARHGGVTADEVKADVEARHSVFMVERDKPFDAFCVVRQATSEELCIDAVWCPQNPALVIAAVQHVKNIAAETGCTRISFKTPRKGWRKRAAMYGFEHAGGGLYVWSN